MSGGVSLAQNWTVNGQTIKPGRHACKSNTVAGLLRKLVHKTAVHGYAQVHASIYIYIYIYIYIDIDIDIDR